MTQKVWNSMNRENLLAELERLREELTGTRENLHEARRHYTEQGNRLHRIEEAARAVDEAAGLKGSASKLTAALRVLNAALEEEAVTKNMEASALWPIIDYSRYRVAEIIVDRFRGGESAQELAQNYDLGAYAIEVIVAAFDRRGMHRPEPF